MLIKLLKCKTLLSLIIALVAGTFLYAQDVPNDADNPVKGITFGRAKAVAIGLIALSSLILAIIFKKKRSKGNTSSKIILLPIILAIVSIVLAGIQLYTTQGAVFGSGSGKAGAIVAIIISLIALALNYKKRFLSVIFIVFLFSFKTYNCHAAQHIANEPCLAIYYIPSTQLGRLKQDTIKMKQFSLLVRVPVTYTVEQVKHVAPLWERLIEDWKGKGIYVISFAFPGQSYTISGNEKVVNKEPVLSGDLKVVSILVLQAENVETVLNFAKQCPVFQQGGTVEVREIPKPIALPK